MTTIDWLVFFAALAWVVLYGVWRARGKKTADSFTVAGHQVPWYAVGLSIMATQASAVTFISTTGQAYVDGMRFVQFYFGLPIAMVILAYTAVPLFRAAGVYTPYEYLERRFDGRVRTLVSGIFLLQRGLALGVTLYAPAVVLTVIFGWPDWATTLLIGGLAISYTSSGGAKAIAWSDLQQMIVMTVGLAAAFIAAVLLLPDGVSFRGAVSLAAAAGRLNVITTTLDWNDRYNLWSGLIGGAFLALAYFGTDQTQVQRYLSGESLRASRRGLMLNAVAKIPMQLCILFIGVMVYVFYIFQPPPLLFQRLEQARLESPAMRRPMHRWPPVSEGPRRPEDGRHAPSGRGRGPRRRINRGIRRLQGGARRRRGGPAGCHGAGRGLRRRRRQRHELHLPDLRHRAPASRSGRSSAGGHPRRHDDGDLGRDDGARDGVGGRRLRAARAADRQ